MRRLKGKVALITGTASNPGLGYATAVRLAAEGAKLMVTDIDAAGADACREAVERAGGEAMSLRHDVTSEEQWVAAIERAEAAWGRLDILVNNAGIAVLKPVTELTLADFERQMRVNMTSVFLGTRLVIPAMRRAGGGSIINFSSTAGLVGVPTASAYAASKGGVRLFSKSVALEHARENIRCNSVHPGVIDTNMQQMALRENPGQAELIKASVPMGRMGEPEDIANCVLFLASDESKYITGAELVVDGGVTAQ